MMRFVRSFGRRLAAAVVLSTLAAPVFAAPPKTAWLSQQVPDGPAAADTRLALEALENGEGETDVEQKLVHYNRGLALAKRAVDLDPRSADAQFAYFANWGRILQADGWLRNAFQLPTLLTYLDRALELNPDHADALASRAALYLELPGFLGGDVDKGEPMIRRAIAIDPSMAGGRLALADHCLATDRRDEAVDLTLQALQIARENGKRWHETRALELLDELEVTPPAIAASSKPSPLSPK